MRRDNVNDLLAFLAVARERSFTPRRQEGWPFAIRAEPHHPPARKRLGVRLLTRTTRAVSPTEAGQRLLDSIGPSFDEIESQVAALSELRDKPAGTIRIVASDYAINYVLWPKLEKISAEISRHQGRAFARQRPDRYRHTALRCGCPHGRATRQGHDFGPHRPGLPLRGGRCAVLLQEQPRTVTPTGPRRPQLHQ